MKAPFSAWPALPAAAGIIAGILLADHGLQWWSVTLGGISFLLCYSFKRHYAAFFALMTAIGSLIAYAHKPEPLPGWCLDGKHQLEARVLDVQELENGMRISAEILKIDSLPCPRAKVSIMAYQHHSLPEVGSVVRASAKIEPIPLEPVIPFDGHHPEWLKRQGVDYAATVAAGKLNEIGAPSGWDRMVNRVRGSFWNGLVRAPVDGDCAAFLVATILGDRSFLVPQAQDAFRASGTSHVLALSGLHVGIIASIFGAIFFPLGWHRRGFFISLPIIMVLIWSYAIITGLSASVTRASVMITFMMACTLMQRRPQPFNSLCLAAVAILAFSPYQLYSPGFQLSFSAVLTVLVFANLVPGRLKRKPLLYFLVMAAVIPVSAMLGTGLISAYYFHIFPMFFLLANVVVGIFIGPVVGLGFVLMILSMMGFQPEWLGSIENFLYLMMQGGVNLIGEWGGALTVKYFTAWAFVPYALAIGFLGLSAYRYLHEEKPYASLALALVAIMATGAVIAFWDEERPQSELFITDGTSTAIIMRDKQDAFFLPLSGTEDIEENLRTRFSGYLASRCPGHEMQGLEEDCPQGPFQLCNEHLMAGSRTLRIFRHARPAFGESKVAVDYALIGPEYKGDLKKIIELCHPDTIYIGGAVAPSRERRFLREDIKDVTVIPLRHVDAFRLVLDEIN